ncbi:hypothetical protein Tco_1507251 [Tanacetum coccineum]
MVIGSPCLTGIKTGFSTHLASLVKSWLVQEQTVLDDQNQKRCCDFELDFVSTITFVDFRQVELTVSDAHMDAFRQQLQSEKKQAIIEKERGLHSYTDLTM